jgi:DNA-binding NarL/FixJ family response regulator
LKSVTSAELLATIRSARSGGRLTLAVSARSMWEHRDDNLLSRREREILELAARALSNSQIASRLFVAEATVKRHMHNAFRKLGAVSRIDAVNKAKTASMISTGEGFGPEPERPPVRTATSATCADGGACRWRCA